MQSVGPKPFDLHGGYAIACGDSRQLIEGVPDRSVDVILTDPPYNIANYSTGNIRFRGRKALNNDISEWDTFDFAPGDWVDAFRRVLKPTGTIFAFCAHNRLGDWHRVFDPVFDTFQFAVWHKTNPPPKIRKSGFLNSCELIVCLWNKGHTWNFGRQNDMHNLIESPKCMGHERSKTPHHPTQKPVKVLSRLIALASVPGDVVFDPFMGVGSTGVAAIGLGRKFLGFDSSQDYVDGARRRLEASVGEATSILPFPNEDRGEARRRKVGLSATGTLV